jgi:hypothetical protein
MSFFSWFKKVFSHFKPADYVKMLQVAKANIDGLAGVEGWTWKQQFDDATNNAITQLQNWQPGTPVGSVVQAIELALNIVEQNTKALNAHDQAVIAIFVSTAETVLALIGK